MTRRAAIDDFLVQHTLAVVGVSRRERGFGRMVYKTLKERGHRVFPVNPGAERIGEEPCYPSLAALPEPVGGAVIVVPPAQTEQVLRDAVQAGIRRVWIQPGAGSDAAIRYCEENGVTVVNGPCILMFTEPVEFFHRLHRWLLRLVGRLPK